MKTTSLLLPVVLSSAAAVVLPRETPCFFELSARGSPEGTILEDSVGENRIGGAFPPSNFTISDNVLSTATNQTCLVQPTTSQFECVAGATSVTNFTIADDGALLHDGSEQWWACEVDGPATDGSFDIFGDGLANKTGCESVSLITGGFSCAALGPTAGDSNTLTTNSAIVATSATGNTTAASCPTSLTNATTYISPSFILPISSAAPNTTFPATNGTVSVSPGNSTLLNYIIPDSTPFASNDSNMCALIFLFPTASSLANPSAPYYFSGTEEETGESGGLDFILLSETADASTTWTTINSTSTSELLDFGTVQIVPGNAYEVARFECAGERAFTVEVSSVGNVEVLYAQDSNPSAIGAFVVPCV